MPIFRKKPVEIEAMRVPDVIADHTMAELGTWLGPFGPWALSSDFGGINIQTLEGTMLARPGDWIIRGVKGELYPCKPDIFAATYEPVE